MEIESYIKTYTERLNELLLGRRLRTKYTNNHLIIFDIDTENKREIFKNAMKAANWISFDDMLPNPNNVFDYRCISDSIFDKKRLYNLFKEFNDKYIIIDNDSILTKQTRLNIIEGAVCSSPNSGSKWPIRLDGEKDFIFRGNVIILTNLTRETFNKSKKFNYLNRDMIKL